MAPRRAVDFDVIDPMSGVVLDHKSLAAGERFELSGNLGYHASNPIVAGGRMVRATLNPCMATSLRRSRAAGSPARE